MFVKSTSLDLLLAEVSRLNTDCCSVGELVCDLRVALARDHLQISWNDMIHTILCVYKCVSGKCCCVQSWAQLEEQQGLYQRANELRSFSLQSQTSVVAPLNLGTQADDPLLTSVLKQVSFSSHCEASLLQTQVFMPFISEGVVS